MIIGKSARRQNRLSMLVFLFSVLITASCSDSTTDVERPDPDTTAPEISLAVSETVVMTEGDLIVTATATDNEGVSVVEFYDGATMIGTDDQSPFDLTVSYVEADNGMHHHWAVAKDAADNSAGSDTLDVIVAINLEAGFVNGTFDTDASGWAMYNCDGSGGHRADGGNPGGYVCLNETGSCNVDPTIEQEVSGFIPGFAYTISGDYRTYVDWYGNPAAESFVVTVDSVVIGSWARSPAGTDWYPFSVEFVATQFTHTIGVHAEWECDDSSYDVDNLELTLSP